MTGELYSLIIQVCLLLHTPGSVDSGKCLARMEDCIYEKIAAQTTGPTMKDFRRCARMEAKR